MLASYVLADLLRNPRRTLSTMVGITLGVGLFCGVLFFIDGLSASMTQRAVAPLPLDMQRIVSDRIGGEVVLTQTFAPDESSAAGRRSTVNLELRNTSDVAVNEVTIRSAPDAGLRYVAGSAELDGTTLTGFDGNPFANGAGTTGLNLGTVAAGRVVELSYMLEADPSVEPNDQTVRSTYSSRESVNPLAANHPSSVPLDELVAMIQQLEGVADARPLSFADLGSGTLSIREAVAGGPTRAFGFDRRYAELDGTIRVVDGELAETGATISVEAARSLNATVGQTVSMTLPDGTSADFVVTGIADLTRSRALFSSRRGGDLETFIYSPNSVIVSPDAFSELIFPAYERAAVERGSRLKNPPVREVDISLDRELLAADPATALVETERIAAAVEGVAAHQDFLLDNISNTLTVAAADAGVAKRLFVFLGTPGGMLAAMLAAYAGTVMAEAQRREQATLRIRGASRGHLLRMLGLRTALLTGFGSLVGLGFGYLAAATILGRESLSRASASSLATSAVVGSLGGFLATGLALYITGRRSIDREINEDRAGLITRSPLWRRARVDLVGLVIVAGGTGLALQRRAFDGTAGSVYYGRAVELNLVLLVLPIAVWVTGSLVAARLFGAGLIRSEPASSSRIGSPLFGLYRRSVGRRPWAIGNGAIVVALIVALATSLAAFTASYDQAKAGDARYATGSDIRVTPRPTSQRRYGPEDATTFRTGGIRDATPVVFGVNNVILRSERTSDPANLAAIDPAGYRSVAPVDDSQFPMTAAETLDLLATDEDAVLLSYDMADFLQAAPGDTLNVLLARSTDDQVEIELTVAGLFERLPGFPDGADAAMSIARHTVAVPAKAPDFFLLATDGAADADLQLAVEGLRQGPAGLDQLQIDTRSTTLAADQSSLAALNIAGLVDLDSSFALAMAFVTIAIFVFGLLLQRRREYITLRAQGMDARTIRMLIAAEAATVAVGGVLAGVAVGAAMGFYFVTVLRPLFVLPPAYRFPAGAVIVPALLVLVATTLSSLVGSRLVNRMEPTELLRDE